MGHPFRPLPGPENAPQLPGTTPHPLLAALTPVARWLENARSPNMHLGLALGR